MSFGKKKQEPRTAGAFASFIRGLTHHEAEPSASDQAPAGAFGGWFVCATSVPETLGSLGSGAIESSVEHAHDQNCHVVGFHLGPTRYRFRREFPVAAAARKGTCTFHVEGFPSALIGKGKDVLEASYAWACQTHSVFQTLQRKAPDRLAREEQTMLAALTECIDTEDVEATSFRTLRQYGRIVEIASTRRLVEWVGYEERELVPLELAPAGFAALAGDERFTAVCERQLPDWDLVAILHVEPVPNADVMSAHEAESELENVLGPHDPGPDVSDRWRAKPSR